VVAIGVGGMALAEDREIVIHNFRSAPEAGPFIDVSSGMFYGFGGGGIYQLTPPTAAQPKWAYNLIYNNPGGVPVNPIAIADAFIYYSNGVVYAFGSGQHGNAIISLTPPKSGTGEWTPTVLYTFSSASDGISPEGPLTMDPNGALYGTAFDGGAGFGCENQGGCGTVFKLTPPAVQGQAWTFKVLYTFSGGAGGQKPGDGVVLDKDGNVYGSAPFDYPSGKSLIFKLTPPIGAGEWTESVLYRFYPTSNCYSGGPLAIDANGALYGAFSAFASFAEPACNDNNNANEYVFQLAPSKSDPNVWVRTEMHTFTYSDVAAGYYLNAPLTVDAGGNVYGATGGAGAVNGGFVFALEPRAGVAGKWNYKALFGFEATTGKHNVNSTGDGPDGGLVFDAAGALYGATRGGGSSGGGVFFELK
jgi:hypothetical protein